LLKSDFEKVAGVVLECEEFHRFAGEDGVPATRGMHTIDAEEAAGDELELEEGADGNLRLAVEVAVVDSDPAIHWDAGHLLQGVLVVALVEQVPSVEEDKTFLPAGVACGFGGIGEDVLNLLIDVLDLLIDLAQPWSEKDGGVGGKDRLVKGCVAIDASRRAA
jgi:hypothetical protein